MDQTSNAALFSLSIDPVTKSNLSETAKWARFLGIVGMIALILMIVFGLFGSAIMFPSTKAIENEYGGNANGGLAAYGSGIFATYMVIMAVIYFFPLLYTLRFASKMRSALASNDQQALNASFQNLKICFRYLGILTIIGLAFLAIGVVFALVGTAALS